MQNKKPKVLAIVGPTASGKSSLAVMIAKKYEGEVISADSRQVYRGLDIGTEKITKEEMAGIPHHLINVCDPHETFTVEIFKRQAAEAIADIFERGKLPIIVGGTGWYVDALLYDVDIPSVPPNTELRDMLEAKTVEELFLLLETKDPERASTIDRHNKRRLVRALEIAEALGSVPLLNEKNMAYDALIIGIETEDGVLKKRIETRLDQTLDRGLIDETRKLHESGITWERMGEFGLEYNIAGRFLRGEINEKTMRERMRHELWQYVKRQRTWFKRNKDIEWFDPGEAEKIFAVIDTFI